MTRHGKITITTLLVVGLSASGCNTQPRQVQSIYASTPINVQQDTDSARRQNAHAAKLIEQGMYDEAETVLKDALTADVMFGPAHNSMGKIFYLQKKYYQAAWEFQYAIKLMPNRPEPKNNLGLVFEAVGDVQKAVDQYGAALALEPDNPELLGNLIRARMRRGDRSNTLRHLLVELLLKDQRPEWVQWARETLTDLGGPPHPVVTPPPEVSPSSPLSGIRLRENTNHALGKEMKDERDHEILCDMDAGTGPLFTWIWHAGSRQ